MAANKTNTQPQQYASSEDFERIFNEEMNSLYLLAFLLTADRSEAERCFVSGLEDAVHGNRVFKQWAHSWAERVIIHNAVRAVRPRPDAESLVPSVKGEPAPPESSVFGAILELDTFARFVYVITVLEHYSDQECAVLLACSRRDVQSARTTALQKVGTALPESPDQSAPRKTSLRELTGAAIGWLIHPGLATSA